MRPILIPLSQSNLHPPKHQHLRRIWHRRRPQLNRLIPLRLTPRHLTIIIQHQPRKYHLDFIRCEESSRTCMAPIPKEQVRIIRGNELVARIVRRRAAFAQLRVPEAVEGGGVGVVRTVCVDGGGGDFD